MTESENFNHMQLDLKKAVNQKFVSETDFRIDLVVQFLQSDLSWHNCNEIYYVFVKIGRSIKIINGSILIENQD